MCTLDEKRVWSYAWDMMDDLSSVPQEYIIDYLLERLQRGQIYTWVDTVLLAINPKGENDRAYGNYNLSRANKYHDVQTMASCRGVQPHIYAIATRAHYRLVQNLGKSSQVIVLNGETGTGKTFNAWKALEFLVARSVGDTSADLPGLRDPAMSGDIVGRIKDACRLISAFTTAPTERNNVSSRHVQVVWLEYKKDSVCGAKISSYLLERNRVTKGRGTYQILRQMMTALSDVEFADTGLVTGKQYFIVSDLDARKKWKLCARFRDNLRAMDTLGFTADQKRDVFQVLSLIVHMGNIQFVQEDDRCRIDTDSAQSREAFANTCRLACLKEEYLAELLTSTLISSRGAGRRRSMCRRNLSTKDACYHRLHSIIRHLYDLLFRWLIKSVNQILSSRLCESNRLGILDIFGFECFKVNGIEQLCVNYVNERLQQHFIEKYVISCQRDLQEEGLIEKEKSLNCYNILKWYEERLDAIRKTLFATLDDMCLSIIPSEMYMLIRQVNMILTTSYSTARQFLKVKDDNFVIRHYAGRVEYSGNDLFTKNTDKIPDELTITFGTSQNRFLNSLIAENGVYGRPYVKKHTMLSKVCQNVDWLILELNRCDAHYVRCIKPCRLRTGNWDRDGLYKQLANTGILHALPLAKCKYPIYFRYQEFCNRYYGNCGNYGKPAMKIGDLAAKIKESLPIAAIKDANSSVHYGKNFIFLKEDLFLILESTRRQRHVESVKKIESFWIKCRAKAASETAEKDPEEKVQQSEVAVAATDTPVNVSGADISSQDDRRDVVRDEIMDREIGHLLYGISLSSLRYQEQKLKTKTGGAETKSGVRDRSIPIHQSENDTARTEQGQNRITIYASGAARNKSASKTGYVMEWLKSMKETASNTRDTEPDTISNQSSVTDDDRSRQSDINREHDGSQSKQLNSDRVRIRLKRGQCAGYYDKENGMYLISHGGSTLFYRNGILTRCPPARLPVKVHTRVTCLANSHYSVYTELPRGLQDCL